LSKLFLDLPFVPTDDRPGKVVIIPVPYERTSTNLKGSKQGPSLIIDASGQLELFDEELRFEPSAYGIETSDEFVPSSERPEEALAEIEAHLSRVISKEKLFVILGGEHTVSLPAVRTAKELYPDLEVLSLDAHADLREEYDGTRFNHACTMRRIVETAPAVQVGVRSMSKEEHEALPDLPTRITYGKDMIEGEGWIEEAVDSVGEVVYVTIDLDVFDPSVIPSTGTPEPGGLSWYGALSFLRRVAESKRVVGFDLVELCPQGEEFRSSFTAAKLAYKFIGYILNYR
jgi:agmatinase